MDAFIGVLGMIGAFLMVSMYALLESGKVTSTQPRFYVLNGMGALFVLVSMSVNFDPGDLGGIFTEGAWLVISIAGLIRIILRRRQFRPAEQTPTRRERRTSTLEH